MRVLLVSTEYPPYVFGGGGTFMQNLAKGLRRHGVEVSVLTRNYVNNVYYSTINTNGIEIHYIPSPDIQPRHIWFQLCGKKYLIKLIERIEPDIIHANSFSAGIFFKFLTYYSKIPAIVTIHGYPKHYLNLSARSTRYGLNVGQISTYLLGYPLWEWLFKLELKYSDKVVAVSEFLRKTIVEDYNIEGDKVIYIPNGIDVDGVIEQVDHYEDHEYFIKNNEKYVLVSGGRLYYEKGHLFLIYALKKIINYGFKDIMLYIFGEGPLRTLLEKKIREYHLVKYVKLLGKLPHRKALHVMNIADVIVIPSLYEIMPLTVLEAIALKKPIVVLNSCYIEEFKKAGINIEVANNVTELGRKIITMLKDLNDYTKQVVNRNYYILRKCFDINTVTRRYINIYKKMVIKSSRK